MGDHLWKQCVDWLCRLEVLPANHRIAWPDATIQDLAYTLRDGVLLCHIAATLDPTSIDPRNVNQRPQMAQFLCLKNIRAFLHACSGVFGIKETDLFTPSMLYDYSDFARVLHTLSRLSNSHKGRTRISGFPVQAGSLNAASQDEDQVNSPFSYLFNPSFHFFLQFGLFSSSLVSCLIVNFFCITKFYFYVVFYAVTALFT